MNRSGRLAARCSAGHQRRHHLDGEPCRVLAGRLYGNTRGANGQSNAHHENLKRIHISESEFKARVQRGEDADGVLADVPLARAQGAAKALDKKISDLRKFRQTLQTADVPDKREQVNTVRVS